LPAFLWRHAVPKRRRALGAPAGGAGRVWRKGRECI